MEDKVRHNKTVSLSLIKMKETFQKGVFLLPRDIPKAVKKQKELMGVPANINFEAFEAAKKQRRVGVARRQEKVRDSKDTKDKKSRDGGDAQRYRETLEAKKKLQVLADAQEKPKKRVEIPREFHEPTDVSNRELRSKSADRDSRSRETKKSKKSKKSETKKKSKSLECLLRSKSNRTRSAESLNRMVESYKTCCSLIELARVPPQLPEGLLQLDPSMSASTTSTVHRSRPSSRERQRNDHNTQHHSSQPSPKQQTPPPPPTTTSTVRRQRSFKDAIFRTKRHSDTNVNRAQKVDYNDFKLDLEHTESPNPKMLARATRALQEHVKDVTEKTKSCCSGKSSALKENMVINSMAPQPHQQHHHQQQHQHHQQHHQQHHPQTQVLSNNHYNQHYHQMQQVPQHVSLEQLHYVTDKTTGTTYLKGRLLGKGGFAKCYELTDVKTNKTYAGKIISKNRLSKPHQKEKIVREIELHRNLRNRHVVGFHSYFEDDDNVYIILEICRRKSLVHVLKQRKTLTEPEVRFYMKQLIDGCKYIHHQRIIHRDLKLGNMLLNDGMQVKIADFGLATKVEYEGEKKMTVCGTPNYIAPEVLQKKGHSFEADIWAMGCVMYAMLVGRPPFETSSLKETYSRITSNKFSVPGHLSVQARNLITKLLAADPSQRPTLDKILFDEFFWTGYTPKTLSPSCCDTVPKFTHHPAPRPRSYAAPVSPAEAMKNITTSLSQLKGTKRSTSQIITKTPHSAKEEVPTMSPMSPTAKSPKGSQTRLEGGYVPHSGRRSQGSLSTICGSTQQLPQQQQQQQQQQTQQQQHHHQRPPSATEVKAPTAGSAIRMYQMLTTCLHQMPADSSPAPVHSSKPLWVTKWVDYSNKYGFGFQLSDKSVGVLFNDTTRMLLATDCKTIQYNDLSNKVYTFTTEATPAEYEKKATLLLYFAQYMDEHLIHGGDVLSKKEGRAEPTAIFMKKWFRTNKAIVMYLNNGTLQVNFFDDHTKVILSPDQQDYLVTFINCQRQAVHYKLLQLRHFGCHTDIAHRLQYARKMLESIINIEGEAV